MIAVVPMELCSFNKATKRLTLASEFCGMPSELIIKSNHSKREIKFVTVKPDDKLFDQDQWDGEQQVYRPSVPLKNVDHLVIYHQY